MPKNMMADDSDMESLYNEGAGDSEGAGDEAETTDEEAQEENADSAMVPMKVLQGKSDRKLKDGDIVKMRIVKGYGDEAEVVCADDYGKEKGGGEEEANSEIDQMDTQEMNY